MSDLSRSLVDAAARAEHDNTCVCMSVTHWEAYRRSLRHAVAAVLETLAAHYYERAAQRGEAGGDGPQCDGDCDSGDCHMTSAVAAWQMAAATAQRVTTELREGR